MINYRSLLFSASVLFATGLISLFSFRFISEITNINAASSFIILIYYLNLGKNILETTFQKSNIWIISKQNNSYENNLFSKLAWIICAVSLVISLFIGLYYKNAYQFENHKLSLFLFAMIFLNCLYVVPQSGLLARKHQTFVLFLDLAYVFMCTIIYCMIAYVTGDAGLASVCIILAVIFRTCIAQLAAMRGITHRQENSLAFDELQVQMWLKKTVVLLPSSVALIAIKNIDKLAVLSILPTQDSAIYVLLSTNLGRMSSFGNILANYFLPMYSKIKTPNASNVNSLYQHFALSGTVFGLVLLCLLVFEKPFLHLVLGPNLLESTAASTFLKILLFYNIINLMIRPARTFLFTTDLAYKISIIDLISLLLLILTMITLYFGFGGEAIIYGMLSFSIINYFLLINAIKKFPLKLYLILSCHFLLYFIAIYVAA